jgi:hypothetical protein
MISQALALYGYSHSVSRTVSTIRVYTYPAAPVDTEAAECIGSRCDCPA